MNIFHSKNKMKARCLLFVVIFTFTKPSFVYPTQGKHISANEILGFCQSNGLKFLTFVTTDKSLGSETFLKHLIESAQSMQSLRTRSMKTNGDGHEENHLWNRYHFDQDTLVFISYAIFQDANIVLRLVEHVIEAWKNAQ